MDGDKFSVGLTKKCSVKPEPEQVRIGRMFDDSFYCLVLGEKQKEESS